MNERHPRSNSRPLTSGQLAKAAGVGVETLRFYERRGLIEEPPRRASGRRAYPVSAVARLQFIRRAKGLGFTLEETSVLLALRVDDERSCADVHAVAVAKLEDVRGRVRELQEMERALERLAKRCLGPDRPTSDCPILDELGGGDVDRSD